jgi:hypothetical protein
MCFPVLYLSVFAVLVSLSVFTVPVCAWSGSWFPIFGRGVCPMTAACHGFDGRTGTLVWSVCLDSSTEHGFGTTQLGIRPSNFDGSLCAVDGRQVSGISGRSDFKRSLERQMATQTGVTGGCIIAGEPSFWNRYFKFRCIISVLSHCFFCQGQCLQPLALALWEGPQPLATRDALETP